MSDVMYRAGDGGKNWTTNHVKARHDAIVMAKKRLAYDLKRYPDHYKNKIAFCGEWVWASWYDKKTKKPVGRPWRYCAVEVYPTGKIFYVIDRDHAYKLDSSGRVVGHIPIKNGKVSRPY